MKKILTTKKTWLIAGGAGLVLVLGGTGAAFAATSGDDDTLTGTNLTKATDAALAAAGPGTVIDAETSDDADHAYEVELRAEDGTETDVKLNADFGVVTSTVDTDDDGGNDRDDNDNDDNDHDRDDTDADDAPITDAERTSVEAAAIAAAGAGTVTDLERSDDVGVAWEIEVRAADGTETDVELDAALAVVTTEVDLDD
jgi:uncharacterized membrane protein YkoI